MFGQETAGLVVRVVVQHGTPPVGSRVGVFFTCLSPLAPARPESHRSRGQFRLDVLKLNILADKRPRSGWSRPRIVETSDILYFILYPKKYV
jgi:hypothetical protein